MQSAKQILWSNQKQKEAFLAIVLITLYFTIGSK